MQINDKFFALLFRKINSFGIIKCKTCFMSNKKK